MDNSILKGSAPAEQMEKVGKKFKSILKKLSRGEKIVALGAILSFISFFLTWLSVNKYVAANLDLSENMSGRHFGALIYLLPILMIIILIMLYFSIGASEKTKAKRAAYPLIIGTVFATMAVVLFVALLKIQHEFFSATGYSSGGESVFTIGFGWWVLLIGSLMLVVGAFSVQRKNLKE